MALMFFLTALRGGKTCLALALFLVLSLLSPAVAQTETNAPLDLSGPLNLDSSTSTTNLFGTNATPAVTPTVTETTTSSIPTPPAAASSPGGHESTGFAIFAALLTLASFGGFLLYYCGLTRAKNCAHTSTLLLVGALFGLTGYWIGGFALQTGGIGDAHAALMQPIPPAEKSALDHELGFTVANHHWGLMGSSGFFLITDTSAPEAIALLFLLQAAVLMIAVTASLGAGLERGKLLSMACCAYLIGVLVYPLLANWIWGGGWLAQLGREYDLGHGVVDLAGADVIHETAGVLALVMAITLGPRHGRFRRNRVVPIPGHNVPFIVLGSSVLLISWIAINAFAASSLAPDPTSPRIGSFAGLAAINTFLAAIGGLVISFVQATWQKQRPEPARLCRGLLGGAIACSGCSGLIDPWAAFAIGGVAALLIQGVVIYLEHKRIDDPVNASAVHGVGGAWGVLAVGLFSRGTAGFGLNDVEGPVRGLFFGGAWHQLAAQVLGCITTFVVIYVLGLACVTLVQKILGNRTRLEDEATGLDWSETGALGYQGDIELEDVNGKS